MLARKLLGASKASPSLEYIGSVTKNENSSSGWDSSGEALDVLSIADTGDLVIIAFSFDSDPSSFSWSGMSFTSILNRANSINPGGYVGYRVIQSGDSNPYVNVSSKWTGLSIVASVFRGSSYSISSATTTGSSGMPNPPSLTANKNLWIATGGLNNESTTSWSAPSGYTLAGIIGGSYLTWASTTAIAYKFSTGSSENPGNFSGSSSDPWLATTIGVS